MHEKINILEDAAAPTSSDTTNTYNDEKPTTLIAQAIEGFAMKRKTHGKQHSNTSLEIMKL